MKVSLRNVNICTLGSIIDKVLSCNYNVTRVSQVYIRTLSADLMYTGDNRLGSDS